ncbi:DUF2470 domain-containing protein [Blastococcus haudaquaticus]|uniref:DUF2470 domain-containing protein n=1 Tax=Blastococcus haudaquaticus TaxID=1938745 RepID=A0A286GPV6_9ACTN|nr:DUF2470 domain-containing protein [Blastococcus haudaquaticus]SOD97532.1 Protein of unknown function [Blastococcus haudaquaticus]
MATCPSRPAPEPQRDLDLLRPGPAERARTVAGRHGATVCAAGVESSRVLAHAVTDADQVLVALPAGGDLVGAVRAAPGADLSALVMVSDHAPVPLRRPLRAQLWLSGWLTPVPDRDQRAAVLAFAEARPAEVLLDVGRSITLLRLDLAEVVLGEGGPAVDVSPLEFLAARPDPLAALEADHLAHLDGDHPEFLALLSRLLPAGALGPADALRPLGLDRFGFRLRVERPGGHQDVRVPFGRPLTCPGELGPAIGRLACAARNRLRPA